MSTHSFVKRSALVSALAALVAVCAPGSASAAKLPNCTEVTNLEAIVDDSGSMASNDSLKGRRQIIEILADLNRDVTFGGSEFGELGSFLFPPTLATEGRNTPLIAAGLALIQDEGSSSAGDFGGSTNYNAGFAAANAVGHNPNQNAKLFLSDGEHNEGVYANGHNNAPKVKTIVVGFGGALSSAGSLILNKIAVDTGGSLLTAADTTDILRVASRINARINCETDPIERQLQFNKPKSTKTVRFKADGRTADIVVTHGSPGAVIAPLSFTQGKGGKGGKKSVASVSKVRKVRGTKGKGDNYQTVHLTGLKKGKVKFKVRAKTLSVPTTATVQITP